MATEQINGDDWSQWRNHVLAELKRQNENIEALRDKIDENEIKRLNEKTNTKIDIKEIQTKIIIICGGISILVSAIVAIGVGAVIALL